MTQLTTTTDSPLPIDPPCEATGLMSDLNQLTKARLTVLVVITTWLGYAMGLSELGLALTPVSLTGWMTMGLTLVATAMACMGASVFNQIIEREHDARMHRTRNRPVAAGRIPPQQALLIGMGLSMIGCGMLAAFINPLSGGIAAFTIITYALVYTPLKRISHISTIVGAVPGALPPLIGHAAATGTLGHSAWLMFLIMFVWQMPHFLAIAWLYREDYARGGFPMLPVIDPSGARTFRQVLCWCLALLPLGLLPTLMHVSGMLYFAGALISGLAFLGFGLALVRGQSARHARAMFLASLVYLPVVLGLMVIDRVG